MPQIREYTMKEYGASEMEQHQEYLNNTMRVRGCMGFGFLGGAFSIIAGIIIKINTGQFAGFPFFFLTLGILLLVAGIYSSYQYRKITR